MTVDIRALLGLFPEPNTHTQPTQQKEGAVIRGACPYDALRAIGPNAVFSADLVRVVDEIRKDSRWGPVFGGDLSYHDGDHSKADLALCGELARRGLGAGGIDTAMRASGLYREKWERYDYRENTIARAMPRTPSIAERTHSGVLDLQNGRIEISTDDPLPRDWVVDGLLLARKSAVLAGFGGVSKTQLAIQLAINVALGLPFAGKRAKQGHVLMLLGEEDRDEIVRRVSAVVRHEKMSLEQIDTIRTNLLGFPFVGQDMRITNKVGPALSESGLGDHIISAAGEAGNVRLIVLDHLALLHGGDFNAREDAALTMRVVNQIALQTGAAVLVLAHSPKSAAGADAPDANMVAGSTAFVDQARAGMILATMGEKQAKKFGFDHETRLRHVSLTTVKNNYGPTGEVLWFERVPFDGVGILQPTSLMPLPPPLKGDERLAQGIINIVAREPGCYSRTRFREKFSGMNGPLKASKANVDRALENLLDDNSFVLRKPTDDERKRHHLTGQTREVLDLRASK